MAISTKSDLIALVNMFVHDATPAILMFVLAGVFYLIYRKRKSIELQLPEIESELFGKELQLQRLKEEEKHPVSSAKLAAP